MAPNKTLSSLAWTSMLMLFVAVIGGGIFMQSNSEPLKASAQQFPPGNSSDTAAMWKFDESEGPMIRGILMNQLNSLDTSGSNAGATFQGGRFGNAVTVGANFIPFPNIAWRPEDKNFTITFWFKSTVKNSSVLSFNLLANSSGAYPSGLASGLLALTNGVPQMATRNRNAALLSTLGPLKDANSNGVDIADNAWHFLTIAYQHDSESNTLQFTVDGQVFSNSSKTYLPEPIFGLNITLWSPGSFDDLRVINGTITPSYIQSLSGMLQLQGSERVREFTVVPYDFIINFPPTADGSAVTVETANGASFYNLMGGVRPDLKCSLNSNPPPSSTTRTVTLLPGASGKCAGTLYVLFGQATGQKQTVTLKTELLIRTKEVQVEASLPVGLQLQSGGNGDFILEVKKILNGYQATCGSVQTYPRMAFSWILDAVQQSISDDKIVYTFSGPVLSGNTPVVSCFSPNYTYKKIWNMSFPPLHTLNGITEQGEFCDDGNTNDADDCKNNFNPAPITLPWYCGDSMITPPESCDDGNTFGDDNCTATCQIPQNEEVLSFSFENQTTLSKTMIDDSPKKTNGVYFNKSGYDTTPLFSWNDTLGGKALQLNNDSSDNKKQNGIRTNVSYDFNGRSYTISFWANPENGGTVFSNKFMPGTANSGGWSLSLSKTTLTVSVQSGANDGVNKTALTATENFSGWNNFTLVIKTASNADLKQSKFYLNGNVDAPLALTATDSSDGGFRGNMILLPNSGSYFIVGMDSGASAYDNFFNGSLDGIHIVKGILSASEIKNLYQGPIAAAAAADVARAQNLTANLLTYIPFDAGNGAPQIKDFAGDIVGIQRDQNSVRNSQTLVSDVRPGASGTSLKLNKNSYQMLDLGQGFDLDGGAYTIDFWAKFTGAEVVNSHDSYAILSKKDALGYGWRLTLYAYGSDYGFRLSSTFLTSGNNVKVSDFYFPTTPLFDQWAQYTFILDSAAQKAFYSLNGAALVEFSKQSDAVMKVTPYNPAGSPLIFGASNANGVFVNFLDIKIDDLYLFNKALDAGDIAFVLGGKLKPADKSGITKPISFSQKPSVDNAWNTDQ